MNKPDIPAISSESAARDWIANRVSRETYLAIEQLAALTAKWQRHINLVSPASLSHIWQRHLVDSAQLQDVVPMDRTMWIDLGSGGGFPGLVIALLRREHPGFHMHLVESNGKKCAFLREAARQLGLPITVHMARIEQILPGIGQSSAPVQTVISARALASLTVLLDWCSPLLATGALAVFPKGQDVDEELIVARKTWNFDCDLIQSISEPRARILRIAHLSGRGATVEP